MTEIDEAELRQVRSLEIPGIGKLYTDLDMIEFITRKQQELVESILAEIPDVPYDIDDEFAVKYVKNQLRDIKQLIRDKYEK